MDELHETMQVMKINKMSHILKTYFRSLFFFFGKHYRYNLTCSFAHLLRTPYHQHHHKVAPKVTRIFLSALYTSNFPGSSFIKRSYCPIFYPMNDILNFSTVIIWVYEIFVSQSYAINAVRTVQSFLLVMKEKNGLISNWIAYIKTSIGTRLGQVFYRGCTDHMGLAYGHHYWRYQY